MTKILTSKDAYLAMYSFLKDHYQRTKSDEIGSLLSSMSLMRDGLPMDQACWSEWEQAIEKAVEGSVDANLEFSDEIPSSS